MSRDFFNKAAENTVQLEKQIMPQPYKYYKFIKTPKEMGMSTKGGMKDLQDNVAALVSYGEVLISGKGAATDAESPLGNKYFIKTGGQCKSSDGGIVDRYAYIDNVPKGNIPMSESAHIKYNEFTGLIPGMMQDIEDINTAKLFRGFMEEEHPKCLPLTLPVIDGDNKETSDTHYISEADIREMNPCSFPNKTNPITGVKCVVPDVPPNLSDQILERTEYGGHIPGEDEAKAAAATHDHADHHPGGVGMESGAGTPSAPETPPGGGDGGGDGGGGGGGLGGMMGKMLGGAAGGGGMGMMGKMLGGKMPPGAAGMMGKMMGGKIPGGLGGMMGKALAAKKSGISGMMGKAMAAKKGAMSGMMGKAAAAKKGGFGGMLGKAKAFAKKKAKGKMGGMFKKRFGFQNIYDNQTLCENLDQDEFAKFYLIAFTVLMGYLLYKATQRR